MRTCVRARARVDFGAQHINGNKHYHQTNTREQVEEEEEEEEEEETHDIG